MVRTVKKPEVRRLEIVRAARTLFLSRGYDQTAMQDVVDALGLAKGTVYYYFPSKEYLLEAVVEDLIDEATEKMQDLVDQAEGGALDKLEQLVKGGRMQDENADLLETIHLPGNSALHTRLLAVGILKQAPLFAAVIEQGCREGVFRTESPLETAEFMLTGVQFLTDMGIHPWKDGDLARRAGAFPSLLEQLLDAPRGSCSFLF